MANHKSSKKRIRQTVRKTEVNTVRKSRVRTAIRKVMDAITSKEEKTAKSALQNAESQIMKAVSKGVIKKNTASRKVSRLSSLIKKSFVA